MKRLSTVVAVLVILALVLAMPAAAQMPSAKATGLRAENLTPEKAPSDVFIVRLVDDPVVAYEGDTAGLPATKPGKGEKINPNSNAVQRYVAHLKRQHDAALNAVGAGASKVYDYYYSFNGFAAALTPGQAAKLATRPDVLSVAVEEVRYPTTDNSPTFLGLTSGGGLWEQLGDPDSAGEDMIVGVIDTGIWPEHPSFSDQANFADRPGNSGKAARVYGPPPAEWYGACEAGEQWAKDDCNNKLIGARYFRKGADHATVIPDDYKSARDKDGHGSHTASTAAGNYGVPASIFGVDRGTVSGMAPRARVAAYKVCWNDAGCYLSDIVGAIDSAVADGVDVINYSIGGGPSLLGADDITFLFAERAGVFVATSAGNSGPGAGTVGGPATVPWITAVGASTQNRTFEGSVVLGNGAEYTGASVTAGTDVLPLVDSSQAGSELCFPGELNSAAVAGKIVLCKRGAIARVDKSLAVYMAGGAGMVLYNTNDQESMSTDNHWVPSVHINYTDGAAIKAYIAGAGGSATAQVVEGDKVGIPAPWMADFSSRGPDLAALDLIKPDVTAPGVNILAANTPNPFLGSPGQLFQSIGGTSMSSPHVAGVAALLRQLHPDWSPAMVKSALMTSASQGVMKQDGVTPADPFDMGGGHIAPNSAADPGLVYPAGFNEYLGFLCDAGPEIFASPSRTCGILESMGVPTETTNLNLASIGIAELVGTQTVKRTVTNVGDGPATYTVSVDAPSGIDVTVEPNELTLDAGNSASFDVTFTRSTATLDEWAFGSLTWSDGAHSVRSPIAVKPVALTAPYEVSGSGDSGSLSFDVTFGYTGDYTAAAHGLVPATETVDNVLQDSDRTFDPTDVASGGAKVYEFDLTGAAFFRVAIPPEATEADADLDVFVYNPSGDLVALSTKGGTDELVDIASPADGTWKVYVHGWFAPGGDSDYTMYSWVVPGTTGGSLEIVSAPSAATIGQTGTITVSWSGLSSGTKHLGAVSHSDAGGVLGLTLVDVSVP